MQAEIAVGIIFSAFAEHPNLILAVKDDLAIAVLEIGCLGDKLFGHCARNLRLLPWIFSLCNIRIRARHGVDLGQFGPHAAHG
jgi:hypothetical protein